MGRLRSAVLTAVIVLLGVGLTASAAAPWGACGHGTDENKLVTQYLVNQRTYFYLRCGGPRWVSDPTSGYRHILAKHRGQFEGMAVGTTRTDAT